MNQLENTLTSLEVAEMVGKNHKEVLRDIRKIIEQSGQRKVALTYFQEDSYEDVQGKSQPMYRVTKKGCEVFGNRMAGAKGTQFTFGYVERFNQMEQHIKQQPDISNLSPELQMFNQMFQAVANQEQKLLEVNDKKEDIMTDKLSGMNMKSTIINESGLYEAIIGSKKKEVKPFKRWITHEVLPTIRKHGAYMTDSKL